MDRNIKSREALAKSLWDWYFLNDCFGTSKIKIGDADGFIEHNWNFLMLEGKPTDKEVAYGQRTALERFASFPQNTVIIAKGVPETVTIHELRWISSVGSKIVPGSKELMQKWVSYWYNYAHWYGQTPINPPPDNL